LTVHLTGLEEVGHTFVALTESLIEKRQLICEEFHNSFPLLVFAFGYALKSYILKSELILILKDEICLGLDMGCLLNCHRLQLIYQILLLLHFRGYALFPLIQIVHPFKIVIGQHRELLDLLTVHLSASTNVFHHTLLHLCTLMESLRH
jgi:hypothetical protein